MTSDYCDCGGTLYWIGQTDHHWLFECDQCHNEVRIDDLAPVASAWGSTEDDGSEL